MPTYLSPGVYMEEVSSGSKPIEGVGTAVAAFVGFCEKGPVNEPTLVTNWTQYVATFGEFVEGSYLAHAVYGYFLNGGGAAYVVRIGANGDGDGDAAKPVSARAELPGGEGAKAPFTASALEAGSAGDDISVEVADASDPGPEGQNFKLIVRKGGQEEVYDNVTVRKGANNVVSKVKAESKLIALEEAKGGQLAAPARGNVRLSGGGAPVPATTAHVDAND
jgi:phage tail sheath protein FI